VDAHAGSGLDFYHLAGHHQAERLNRSLATEWAYRKAFTSYDDRAAAVAPWIEHYNTQRRDSALGGHPAG